MDGLVPGVYQTRFMDWVDLADKGQRVLDFGCGDGRYFAYFKRFFEADNIFGVDVSQTRVDRCRSLGWRNVQRVEPSARLPFPDAWFGFVNFDQVLEHIDAGEADGRVSELARVLRPGGRLIVVTPNYPVKRLYDACRAFGLRDLRKLRDDPTHVAFYDFDSLQALLSRHFARVDLRPTGGLLHELLKARCWSHKIIGCCVR